MDAPSVGLAFNGCEITTIVPCGWAEANGIELDDEIYKVDGELFEGLSAEERTLLFSRERPLVVEFVRPELKDEYFTLNCNESGDLGFNLSGVHVHEVVGLVGDKSPRPAPYAIDARGWAAQIGMRVHDEILAVNGKSLEPLTDIERAGLLADTPRPMTLRIKRYHPEHLRKYGRMFCWRRSYFRIPSYPHTLIPSC